MKYSGYEQKYNNISEKIIQRIFPSKNNNVIDRATVRFRFETEIEPYGSWFQEIGIETKPVMFVLVSVLGTRNLKNRNRIETVQFRF